MKYLKCKICLLMVVFGLSACAAPQPKPITWNNNDLSDAVIDDRIRFIEERLGAHQRHAEIWYWSWMVINSAAVVGLSVAAGVTDNKADRVDYGSQAGLAALGVADLLLRPLEARYGAGPIRELPDSTRSEKLKKLKTAETLLRSNAKRAAERENRLFHLLNLLLNAGVGVATGIAGDSGSGAVSAGAGFIAGEIYILGQPGGPKEDWEAYQERVADGPREAMRMSLAPCESGLMFRLRW